jgi:hypothetical protein
MQYRSSTNNEHTPEAKVILLTVILNSVNAGICHWRYDDEDKFRLLKGESELPVILDLSEGILTYGGHSNMILKRSYGATADAIALLFKDIEAQAKMSTGWRVYVDHELDRLLLALQEPARPSEELLPLAPAKFRWFNHKKGRVQ